MLNLTEREMIVIINALYLCGTEGHMTEVDIKLANSIKAKLFEEIMEGDKK